MAKPAGSKLLESCAPNLTGLTSRVCEGAGSGTGAAPLCAMDSKIALQYTLPDSGNRWD